MPLELSDLRYTANLPTAEDAFPYNKISRSGEKPPILPAGSATPSPMPPSQEYTYLGTTSQQASQKTYERKSRPPLAPSLL